MKNKKKKSKGRKKKSSSYSPNFTKNSSSSPYSPEFTGNRYVPPELLTQILVNLPAKSLLRFRCVCKTWCSIIDDPDFVNMHLQLCNNKSLSGKLLALEGSLCPRMLTLRKVDTLKKICHFFKSSEPYDIGGRCNSLVLLCPSYSYMSVHDRMRLCNPSIRKSLLLPPCPLFPSDYKISFILGFARCSNDFKVIAFSFKYIQYVRVPEIRIAVYTLSDHQWSLRNPEYCSTFGHVLKSYYPSIPNMYYSEGASHWLGNNPYGDNSNQRDTHLISFDFDTESFEFLEVPVALDNEKSSRFVFLRGESLAIFRISSVSAVIWMLKQESGKRQWSLFFSGPSSVDASLFFDNSYPFISLIHRERLLYYEGADGPCFIYKQKSYKIATRQLQSLGNSMDDTLGTIEFELFSESLVLGKGYQADDAASSPLCWDK